MDVQRVMYYSLETVVETSGGNGGDDDVAV